MILSDKERDQLWGKDGPYSQANLTKQVRILDDKVSRVFLEVAVEVNPFTFRLIKKNRHEFADDEMIQQLLDHSEWRGQNDGYVSCAYSAPYANEKIMAEAQKHLEYVQRTIIKMHKYVIKILSSLDEF